MAMDRFDPSSARRAIRARDIAVGIEESNAGHARSADQCAEAGCRLPQRVIDLGCRAWRQGCRS
jgi:hypothetical protein